MDVISAIERPSGSANAAYWSGSARALIETPLHLIVDALAGQQLRHFRSSEREQAPAWEESIAALRTALLALGPAASDWHVLLQYPMLRLAMRIDAVVLTDRAILVLAFKRMAADAASLRQVEDYALNLRDFHDASRMHPIVPVLVSDGVAADVLASDLFWHAVTPVQKTPPASLAWLLGAVTAAIGEPARPLRAAAWMAGAYRPVPTIIEGARMAYARHGVADIAAARADQKNLHATTRAIASSVAAARLAASKIALFVTGIPGAGKTLCGLHTAFGSLGAEATFLTGNPTLVHVLRAALVRDARGQGVSQSVAARQMMSKIQALPHFRNDNLLRPAQVPPESIAIIDEAQRCWSRAHAVRKTATKIPALSDSEPGHLLDIMGRHDGFAAIICLVGSGQEIHDGEGGLAEWGSALAVRPHWQVVAPPDLLESADPRWQLGGVANVAREPDLHLDVAVRQIRNISAAAWVYHLLSGDLEGARAIAGAGGLPFFLTRDLAAARHAARALARGNRRAGMLGSSGGKRLRAEGLGAELPHMDQAAVASWFLDVYPPDVRASGALEQIATEFSCQGLELDVCLLAWDADLSRAPRQRAWVQRQFRGSSWQAVRQPEAIANLVNSYRVLLTRARYETIIFVPRGDAHDPTRAPAVYDGIAEFLHACGASWLDEVGLPDAAKEEFPQAALL